MTTRPAGTPWLSVVIPVYNERATIETLLKRVHAVGLDKEIIVVDDGSTDGTRELLAGLQTPDGALRVIFSYHGRTYAEGKKITWRDGVRGVWCTLRYGLFG